MESEEDKLLKKLLNNGFGTEGRILIEKVNHSGQEVDCYIPQINVGQNWTPENGYNKWVNILSKGSYILKESFNPVVVCKKCDGEGCPDCNNRGFRKGVSVDLKHIAESLLIKKMKELKRAKQQLSAFDMLGR